jgi:hypothetical protein
LLNNALSKIIASVEKPIVSELEQKINSRLCETIVWTWTIINIWYYQRSGLEFIIKDVLNNSS